MALAGVALLTACGTQAAGPGHACTAIGSVVGIRVQIDPEVANKFGRTEQLRVCLPGRCESVAVLLGPATTAMGTECNDQACSAHMRETGGKTGIATIPDLPASPVSVTFAGQTLTITPKQTYPNGPDCGAGGPQAQLTVDALGVRESG